MAASGSVSVSTSPRVLPLRNHLAPLGLQLGSDHEAVVVPDGLVLLSVSLSFNADVTLGEFLPTGAASSALCAGEMNHSRAASLLSQLTPISLLFPLDPVVRLPRVVALRCPHAVLPVVSLLSPHIGILGLGAGVGGSHLPGQVVGGDRHGVQVELGEIVVNVEGEGGDTVSGVQSSLRLLSTSLEKKILIKTFRSTQSPPEDLSDELWPS